MNAVKFEKTFNIILSPKQREVFGCPSKQINLCGLEGTGKSFIGYCLILAKCIEQENVSVFFVSPSDKQSKEKERKVDSIIYNAGKEDLLSQSIARYREFINGSKIYYISASQKPESVKGFHSIFTKEKTNPVVVLLDDSTAISEAFSQAIIASLLTASVWSLILAFNAGDTGDWCYQHYTAGQKDNPDIKTFEFTANDNPLINKDVLKHLGSISSDYIRRFSNNWDASKEYAFPPSVLNPCVDDTFSLNVLPPERDYSYALGVDLNDVLGQSVGRDRDKACFVVLAKRVEVEKTTYKVVAYDSFQRSTIAEWVEAIKRLNRMYPLERFFIESYGASGLVEALKKENFGDRIVLCNPHTTNDTFSRRVLDDYLNTVIHNRMLKIPFDAEALLKELKELKVIITSRHELKFDHKKHHHNDFVMALGWALLGMRDIETTGSVDYGDVLRTVKRGRNRDSFTRHESGINIYDREFLTIPTERDY